MTDFRPSQSRRDDVDAQRALVRAFLRLPSAALPGAMCRWPNDAYEHDAWVELRDFAAGGPPPEVSIRIRADRPGWRGGFIIHRIGQ